MGVEIERKYLLKNSDWRAVSEDGQQIKQGYLNLDKERTVRVRTKNDIGYLTIKGVTENTTRLEFEYEIPIDDANQLLQLCEKSIIEKTRYIVKNETEDWEIDIFEGENKGLEIAEIELESEDQEINLPNWIGKEVSTESKYYNSNLIEHPYKNWGKKIEL